MRRILCLSLVCCLLHSTCFVFGEGVLDKIERKIVKEPAYSQTPRYALLAFGSDAKELIWVVENGSVICVDRNANGDLTDDGPPIEPADERTFTTSEGRSQDCDYVIPRLGLMGGAHTDFRLRRWNYGKGENYGLSLTVGGTVPMYAGWNSFFGKDAKSAPVIHFGAAMRPRILRYKEFVLGTKPARLSFAFITEGRGESGRSFLSYEALPATIIPTAQIDWPVAPGAEPLRTSHTLGERCCYWEFYTTRFEVPEGAVEGTATVTLKLPAGALLDLSTDQLEVPVKPKGTPFKVN